MDAAEDKEPQEDRRKRQPAREGLLTSPISKGMTMHWLEQVYGSSLAVPISLAILATISLLSWRKKGRQIILALTLLLYVRYLVWRGLYTLNTEDWTGLMISSLVLLAEVYGLVQLMFFTFQAWRPLERQSPQ